MVKIKLFAFVCIYFVGLFSCLNLGFVNSSLTAPSDWPLTPTEWSVENDVPEFTIIGKASFEELSRAKHIRAHLMEVLTYWKDLGLPDPPDLESIVYIASYDNIRLVDFLQQTNPGIENIRRHIESQYEHLERSKLGRVIRLAQRAFHRQGEERNLPRKERADAWLKRAFDYYAQFRYGFSSVDFIDDVRTNVVMNRQFLDEVAISTDNAFYGRFPVIELTEILPLYEAKKGKKGEERRKSEESENKVPDLDDLVRWELLEKIKRIPRNHRIVILPRTTQKAGEAEVSSLKDPTIAAHELGHHMNSTLVGDRHLDLMVDEALSDYLAAAPSENPKIGEFFAKASSIVAERLEEGKEENYKNEKYRKLAASLSRLASKGVIRDLEKVRTIDDLNRLYEFEDDHDSGDPIRALIWTLRQAESVDNAVLDEAILNAIYDFSFLPMTVAPRTQMLLGIRKGMIALKRWVKSKRFDLRGTDVMEGLRRLESEARSRRQFWSRFGWQSRPRIPSDYIVPEFLRTFYRVAQKRGPEFADAVRKQSEVVMNGPSILVKGDNGLRDLVFIRADVDRFNLFSKLKLSFILKELNGLKRELWNLEESTEKSLDAIESDSQAYEASRKELLQRYALALQKLQEYERTGSTYRLFIPYPVFSIIQAGGRVSLKLISLLSRSQERKANIQQICDLSFLH